MVDPAAVVGQRRVSRSRDVPVEHRVPPAPDVEHANGHLVPEEVALVADPVQIVVGPRAIAAGHHRHERDEPRADQQQRETAPAGQGGEHGPAALLREGAMVDYRQSRTVEVGVSSPQKSGKGRQRPVVQRFVHVHSSTQRRSSTGPASGRSIVEGRQFEHEEPPSAV